MEGRRRKSRSGGYRRVAEGVYERNGRFYAPYYDNGKKDMGPQYPSKAKAMEARARRQERKAARAGGQETVDSFHERWIRDYGHSRSEATNVHNFERARKFAEDFKDRLLSSIDRREARAWALRQSNKSRVPAVRAMFTDAVRDGFASSNPFTGLGLRRKQEGEQDEDLVLLSPAELHKLIRCTEDLFGDYGRAYFGPLILTAAYTGMRPGELFALRSEDIHWDEGYIEVARQWHSKLSKYTPTKSRRRREIPLLPEAENALRMVPAPHDPQEPIFRTRRGSHLIQRTHYYYWHQVRAAFWHSLPKQRKAEIPADFDFYELRHYFGSYLAAPEPDGLGATAFEIAKALGHKDGGQIAMRHYIRTPERDARKRIVEKARRRQAMSVTPPVTGDRDTA